MVSASERSSSSASGTGTRWSRVVERIRATREIISSTGRSARPPTHQETRPTTSITRGTQANSRPVVTVTALCWSSWPVAASTT